MNKIASPKCSTLKNTQPITTKKNLSKIRALASDTDGKKSDGLIASAIIIDEIWAHKNRKLFDVLCTSTAAKKQPLIFSLSHAGIRLPEQVGYVEYQYGKKVLSGEIPDTSYLPVIYEINADDWENEDEWYKANPSLGTILHIDTLREYYKRAKHNKAQLAHFQMETLGIWQGQEANQWLDAQEWAACSGGLSVAQLRQANLGKICYAGLDLSKRNDLTAITLLFTNDDGHIDIYTECWIPRDVLLKNEKDHNIPYSLYAEQGYLHVTDGNVIDFQAVLSRIKELCKEFNIVEIAYDRLYSVGLLGLLDKYGVIENSKTQFVEFSATPMQLTEPIKEFETLVQSKKLRHGNNPLLTMQAMSARLKLNESGDLFRLVKKVENNKAYKIDSIFAAVIALGRILYHRSQKKEQSKTAADYIYIG